MAPKNNAAKKRRSKRSARCKQSSVTSDTEMIEEIDFANNPSAYFLKITSFESHLEAQKNHRQRYLATIAHLLNMKIELLPSAKVKALTCAWARNDIEMADCFLSMKKIFNFVEVSKSISILDIPRQIKAIEKKISKLRSSSESGKCTVRVGTFRKLEKKINYLAKQKISFGSVSGALCRHVRKWARSLNADELQFMALNFELKLWRSLADIVHFNPESDFECLPWFLPVCYGQKAPEISLVHQTEELNEENVNEILKKTPLPYHKVSKFKDRLTNESKGIIARADDTVGRVIWWYEELECDEVNEVIMERLKIESKVDLGYGKLMERLMLLKPKNVDFYPFLLNLAEQKLTEYAHNLEGPIAVFADASGSMEVAIKIATIISSFLTVFTHSQLVFYNDKSWTPSNLPSSISDVINLALNTKADCSTAPAAALWPFYERKEWLKTIIIVTDEEENSNYENYMFAPLFKKYIDEVGPCNLIFISFLHHQHSKGQMVEELRRCKINATQYVLSGHRPDISKLDMIIGRMSLNESNFIESIKLLETIVSTDGVASIFNNISK